MDIEKQLSTDLEKWFQRETACLLVRSGHAVSC